MKKRVIKQMFTVILTVIMIVTSIPFTATAATTNDDSYIEIRTIEELYNVRDDLSANYILMNDIDLTEATAEGGDWDFMGNGWNPIGSNDVYGKSEFSGHFNGNGYAIKGMRIDVTTLPSGKGKSLYLGLFASVSGDVANLTMQEVVIKTDYCDSSISTLYAGIIAGYVEKGHVEKCQVDGTVHVLSSQSSSSTALTYVAGITGYNSSDIKDCSAEVDVCVDYRKDSNYNYVTPYVGGIAGYNSAVISGCYASGNLLGNHYMSQDYSYVGGIAAKNVGSILNCYNTSAVKATQYNESKDLQHSLAAGISNNDAGTISNCYNIGLVNAQSATFACAISNKNVDTSFYLQNTGVGCSGATSLTETQMLLKSMYKGFDFEKTWIMNANAVYPYPQLISNVSDLRELKEVGIKNYPTKMTYQKWEELDITGCILEFDYVNAENEYVEVTSDMVSGFDSNSAGEKLLTISCRGKEICFTVNVVEKPFYEIYTIMDLYNIRYDLDENYILMNDIDLTEATAKGGEWDFDGRGWNPIGSENIYAGSEFKGIFDGNGYAIKGMRIAVSESSYPSGFATTNYAGLFANVSGDIYNLKLLDVDIYVDTTHVVYVGGIAGKFAGGKISNCSVEGTIYGSGLSSKTCEAVGGVVGDNLSQIVYTHFKGNISGENRYSGQEGYSMAVGGIAGQNQGLVQYSYVEGNVHGIAHNGGSSVYSSSVYVGGIAGGYGTGRIEDCYNTATVTGDAYGSKLNASGIGTGTIVNCYNIGVVSGKAIAYSGTVVNCYYLKGVGSNNEGATSLTETQMLINTMFVGLDFENVWQMDPEANYPYPQFVAYPQDTRVMDCAKIYSLPNKTVYTKYEEFEVSGLQLLFEYKNAEDEYVTVTEDMVVGFDSNMIGKQTLSVTHHGIKFEFDVTVEERPFKEIYTIEDLYNIRKDLTSNYILMNDLDLTEATAEGGEWDYEGRGWNPIGSNDVYGGSTYSGIFDGNGYSIKGMRICVDKVPAGSSKIYVGLFANVSGEIRNLNLINCDIDFLYTSEKAVFVGTLAAFCDEGVISNCAIEADLYVQNEYSNSGGTTLVGGIIGYGNSYKIDRCRMHGKVSGKGNYSSMNVGGITSGNSIQDQILNCYNTAQVEAAGRYSYAYGISDGGNVSNCYNSGQTNGRSIGGSKVTNCYYLEGTGEGTTGATALTEAQMKLEAMYEGFDFDNVWILNSHANYPYAQLRNNVQDLDETVELIRVIAYPSQTNYLTGDVIDPTGGLFEAIYISGKTELLEITADMLSGYDPTLIGKQTITVTYGGQTDTFKINVERRPEITAVELISGPTQKEFVIGTAFDFAGAQIKVSYDNDTSEIIDVTEDMTTGGNINHISEQTITVNAGNHTVSFDVEVIPASISSIAITKLPSKLEYVEGESFDAAGMVVMATYSNGSTVQLKSGYKVVGYSAEPGVYTVTIEFAGQKASFDVTVNERTLLSLEIKAKPDKLNYVVGEKLDLTGLLVVGTFENGELEIIDDYTVSSLDGTAGSKVVTVTYRGKTASFVVNVAVKCVEKIEIIKLPTKLSYIENEALNVEGMIVKATYNDGEIKTITDYKLEGYSSLPGAHTVYVSYDGQVDSFDVNVTEKVLSDLKVTIPTKTTYEIGESFDPAGMVVTVYYNNGQQYSVDNYVVKGFDSNSIGAKEIQITYEGMTRSFVVTVIAKEPIATGGKIEVGTGAARLGETISVPVTITKNTGLTAFCHTITFDAQNLKYKSITLNSAFASGTIIVNEEKAASGEITILWFKPTNVIESGVAYNVNFEVLETATDGISEITINFDANDNGNESGENVLFEAVSGHVEILSYWLGDLDGDRKYAMADLLQLAQYISGQTMTLTDKQKLSADVNEDGYIDVHDVTLLSQWLLVADM